MQTSKERAPFSRNRMSTSAQKVPWGLFSVSPEALTVLEWEMRNKSMYLLERRVLSDFSASWNVSFCLNIPLCSPFFKRAPLFIFNMFTYLFYIFWPHCTVCGILVPQPGIKPTPPALAAWSLNHWTAREVL